MTKNKYDLIRDYTILLKRIGVDLKDEGIEDFAVNIKDVHEILSFAKINKIPIIGGDVMEKFNNRLHYDYNGWSIQKEDLKQNYLINSLEQAVVFLDKVKTKTSDFYVVFVLDFENIS